MYPSIYNWEAASSTAIYYGGDDAPSTGTRSLQITSKSFGNVSRVISISCEGDTSDVNFTISGMYQGKSVSETLAGPDATMVYTTQYFTSVDSVTFDDDLAFPIDIGTGSTTQSPSGIWGVTNWFSYDYFVPNSILAVQTKVITNTVNYTLEVTLDDVLSISESSLALFNPVAGLTAATTTQIGSVTYPIRYARLKFNNATTHAGSLRAVLLQQGLQ